MATNEKNSIIDDTRFDVSEQNETVAYPVSENESAKTNDRSGVKNIMAGVAGLAAGVGGAVLITSFVHPDPESEPIPEPDPAPELYNGEETPVAQNINNDMPFDEAFAAARKEVGAGGIFSWHGRTYGTYYADEWQGFTDEYRQSFSNYPYNIRHEPYTAETPQPIEAELSSDGLANDQQPIEAEIADEYLSDEPQLFDMDEPQLFDIETADNDNPEEVLIIPEDEDDVSILNPYPPEIEAQEITIANDSESDDPVYDNQDASLDLADFNNNADISNFD